MRYDPNNAKPPLMDDGWYEAEIAAAVEKESKAGNPMLQVTYKVFTSNGGHRLIDDYFVSDNQSMLSRLKKLCAAVGHDFSTGEVEPAHLENKALQVNIKTQKSKDPAYDDKNVAAGYRNINDEVQPQAAEGGQGGNGEPSDGIPF